MMKSSSRGMKIINKETRGTLYKKISSTIDYIAELEVGKKFLNYKDKKLLDIHIKTLGEELNFLTEQYNSKI